MSVALSGFAQNWIDGSPILHALFPDPTPAPSAPSAPAQAGPPRFQVGHQRNFFAFNFRTSQQYTSSATLRAVGDFSYIYVENDQWNNRVNQVTVDAVLRAFERDTPGDPNRGIYQIETEAFGNPPDIDGDARIVLLLLDIQDQFVPPTGTFVAGYFTSVNQARGQVRDARWGVAFQSNETEMLYIDVDPLNPALNSSLGIVAHEFQHLIHFAFDADEETWLNEGCAEFAMFLCGYPPTTHVRQFEAEPTVSLLSWPGGVGSSLPYYGGAYLWMLYLFERYGGEDTIGRIVRSPQRGLTSVETALQARGFSESIESVFMDWRGALAADDERFGDGRFGILNEQVRVTPTPHLSYPVPLRSTDIHDWSGRFLEFRAPTGDPLPLQFDMSVPDRWRDAFAAHATLYNGSDLIDARPVSKIPLEGRFVDAFEEFGEAATRIVISVGFRPNSSGSTAADFEYSVRLGEPVGFLVTGFANPIQSDYIEVVAVADAPVETGDVVVELSAQGVELTGAMRSADGGNSFGASFRAPNAAANEWTYRLTHFGQPVANGTLQFNR